MTTVRIGLAQAAATADFSTNSAAVFRFLDEAAAAGVQILCFPETHTVGYRVDVASTDLPVPVAELEDLHARVAARCGELEIACVLGTETPVPGDANVKPYNTALVIDEHGKIVGTHHKTRLTPLDAVAYSRGEGFSVFTLHGVTVGVVICYEGFRFAESTEACVRQGAQLVLHPQSNTTRPNEWKIPVHHAMITTRAAENTVWFASCNSAFVPYQNCRSMVVAPDGLVAAQSELGRQELVVADIDLALATRAMFLDDPEITARQLFADTVARDEFASILQR